jgi:hypothetical protein
LTADDPAVDEDDDLPGFRACNADVQEPLAGLHERLSLALRDERVAGCLIEADPPPVGNWAGGRDAHDRRGTKHPNNRTGSSGGPPSSLAATPRCTIGVHRHGVLVS